MTSTRTAPHGRHLFWWFLLCVLSFSARAEVEIHYVHNDHLGTPRHITNEAGHSVWSYNSAPFGAPFESIGEFNSSLRYPGQHADEESGLHYNHHRYYAPSLGRYVRPDPIGLAGGLNEYLYAYGNPQTFTDSLGLNADRERGPGGLRRPFGTRTGRLGGEAGGGGGGSVGSAARMAESVKDAIRTGIGKPFRTKPNYDGAQQPYDSANGRYLPYEANPGFPTSPIARFGAGFGAGFAESFAGVPSPMPVGTAGNLGHTIGRVLGAFCGALGF